MIAEIKDVMDNEMNVSVTENSALGYETTGKELLDLNFATASMRHYTDKDIIERFEKAYFEDKTLAMRWLFFASDIREGMGERRLFRVIIKHIAESDPILARELVELIPEYSRWDNILPLMDTPVRDTVVKVIKDQLQVDILNMADAKPISLLAKWMPSVNTSSVETRKRARELAKALGLSEKAYRTNLSSLRRYLKVTEVMASANEWDKINYSAVPSKANILYRDAFMKHDKERRMEYLESLKRGEAKINASVLFPHDIVSGYVTYNWAYPEEREQAGLDETKEALWKALPDYVKGEGNTIVVRDGSGSMTSSISGNVSALDVADALSIYFAERSTGEFRDKFITFSRKPKLVDISKGDNLYEKLRILHTHTEIENTNIEAVFDLILYTAVKNKMPQSEIPNILIISDMEFDYCAESNSGYKGLEPRLFEAIAERYKKEGYKLPRLSFWNVNSRTETVPVKENSSGVALVSGFSPVVCNMVLSTEIDPYKALIEALMVERYDKIGEITERYVNMNKAA